MVDLPSSLCTLTTITLSNQEKNKNDLDGETLELKKISTSKEIQQINEDVVDKGCCALP